MKYALLTWVFILLCNLSVADEIIFAQTDTIGNHKLALQHLHQYLSNEKQVKSRLIILQKIAERFIAIEKYDSSLYYLNQGILEAKEENKYALHLAWLYKLKGGTYYYLYDRKTAIKWFERSLKTAELNNLAFEEMQVHSNLGAMYIEEKMFDVAEQHLLKCIDISKKNNWQNNARALMGRRLLGTLYKENKQYSKAKEIFEQLIHDCQASGNMDVWVSATTYYADLLTYLKEYNKAETFFKQALEQEKQYNHKNSFAAIYAHMARFYEKIGDFKNANYCKDSAYQIKIREFKEQLQSSISESESKYNNIVLKNNLELANKRRAILVATFTIATLITLLAWLLFYVKQKKKQNILERQQNEATLAALLEGEEKERMRLARELHDGIVQEIALLGRSIQNAKNIGEEKNQLLAKTSSIGEEVRNISHSLMPEALKSFGLVVALNDLFVRNFKHTNIEHNIFIRGIDDRLPEKIEIAIYRIAQELINNIIKHSKATQVEAQLVLSKDVLIFILEDNGVGMKQTANEGIGLASIESRLRILEGKFEYDSAPESGTVSIVRIPFNKHHTQAVVS